MTNQSLSIWGRDGNLLSVSLPFFAMHPLAVTATILSLVLVVFFWSSLTRKDANRRPPGPRPWPIIGNLNLLSPLPHQDFHKLAKKYGPIYRLRFGCKETFVISSPEIAEEILKTHDAAFASRPHLSQFEIMFYDSQSVSVAPYGPYWRFARKIFTLEMLTNKRIQQFQNAREEEILGGLHSILDKCKDGGPVSLNGSEVGQVSLNIITRMMMNKTYFGPKATASNLTEAGAFKATMKDVIDMFLTFELGNYIPFFKPFDLQGSKKRMRAVAQSNDRFLSQIMEERRRLRSSKQQSAQEEEVMDFLDVLLTRPSGNDESPLTDPQIKGILLDVLTAGTDSTSVSIEWAMTELLRHPDALKKAQDELDAVVGRDRLVKETDLPRLKYINCIVKEVMRLHPVGPILAPHECMQSREVGGYHIPEKAQVFVNVYAIARDPDVWTSPLEFRPERFLSTKIDVFGQDFELLPFGSGRRSCPGMRLARATVDYMMAMILHGCDWSLPPGVRPEDVDLGEAPGVAVCKKIPLQAIAKPRLPENVIYPDRKAV